MNKKTFNEVDQIPQELADYLKFLNETDSVSDKMLTKERVLRNLKGYGNAINFFLAYPDKLVDLMTPRDSAFELYFVQRVVLRSMSRHRQSFMTFTRSFSKSFLAFLSRYIFAMLVPHHKAFIVSGTKIQAAQIAKEKVVQDLWVKFPLLENEMQKFRVAGKLQEPYLQGKDYAEFNFTHGGTFDVVGSGSSIRGARRHSGIFEEVIEHDPIEINEHIIPLMNKQRITSHGEINPHEPHGSKIYVTTAGYQGTFAYEKLIETICYTVIDPDKYIVLGGSYYIPLMVGLLDQQAMVEVLSSPSFQQDSVDREYRSKWSGSPSDGKSYPKCRPSKKISKETPKIASSYNKKEKAAMTQQKRRAEKNNPKIGKGNKPTMTHYNENKELKKVICNNCGWKWDLKDGGDDPYVCHKCHNDNSKKYKHTKITITEQQLKLLIENQINENLIYEDEYGSVQSTDFIVDDLLNEAEYKGRKVKLGKIMQGDIKKFKVYVKNEKGKVVKVNFGFGGKSAKGKRMVIKKNNPVRRKSFRARMNCDNPGPIWKPRFWACRAW